MYDPGYAVHHRMSIRQQESEVVPWKTTVDLYVELCEHILRCHPSPGPLRSMALRRLAESLNDVVDHAKLTQNPPVTEETRVSSS